MTPGDLPLRLPCESTYGEPNPSGEGGPAAADAPAEAAAATAAPLLVADQRPAPLREQEDQLAGGAERVRDGVEVGQRERSPHRSADLGDDHVARGHAS